MTQKFASGSHEIILKRIRDIPSLPEVVNKIVILLGQPNTPASEIAKLISYDPGLTSKVLRMVNSAAYGFQRQISSIQHGIMILGFTTVRGLVLSASIMKLFERENSSIKGMPKGLDHQRFWQHSLGTAMAARQIGKALHMGDIDDVFSAAMLHDIGKIVLDVYFKKDYLQVLTEAKRHGVLPHGDAFLTLEENLLGINHTQIGVSLAQKWKLPSAITEAIAHHHAPQNAQEDCQTVVYLVSLANQLAIIQYEHLGIYNRNYISGDVLDYFGLDDDDLQGFLHLLKEDMDSVQELLRSISPNAPRFSAGS